MSATERWLKRILGPMVYDTADLAEYIVSLLNVPARIAYSARMAEPRYFPGWTQRRRGIERTRMRELVRKHDPFYGPGF